MCLQNLTEQLARLKEIHFVIIAVVLIGLHEADMYYVWVIYREGKLQQNK